MSGEAQTALSYEAAKSLAAGPDPAARAALAARTDAPPELLFYLADDDHPSVRRAVAANDATPVQASARLARDMDADVRMLLGRKLARALPHLSGAEQASLRDIAHHALSLVAADQVVRVRAALAGAIKDVDCAPPKLVGRLARDAAREVAEPLLRSCATLSDEDLVAIVAAHPEPWVLEAIARRPAVSPAVAEAVVRSGDSGAAVALIANTGASVGEAALDTLVQRNQAELGRALAVGGASVRGGLSGRPDLPPHLADRLANLIDSELRDSLAGSGEFDRETREEILAVARRRLDWAQDYARREQPEVKAMRLFQAGQLTEESVWDAASWGDRAFVRAALALLARVPAQTVQRILDTQSARAVTALAWRAGLSMRCARLVQHRAAGIHPAKLLNARHGTDYPLSAQEMRFQLELFGL